MAQRNRKYTIRYGGETCGTGNSGTQTVPARMGDHSCTDETHPGPPYRTGGPLSVRKKKVHIKRFSSSYVFYHSSLGWYDGFMGVIPYVPSPEPTPLNLTGWGAKGWARTQPLHPIYNLGVSIGELKDLPRMVTQTMQGFRAMSKWFSGKTPPTTTIREFLKRSLDNSKNTGDTYLYGAFGLAPMLKDLLFLTEMQQKLDKKITWLRRHNGKAVKREIELNSDGFSEDIVRNVAPVATVFPTLSSFLYSPGMTVSQPFPITKSYQGRIWYSAKYRYFIPELSQDPRVPPPKRLVLDLLGLSADPSIIYKLIPWSWLLDWFTSVGDALSNVYARAVNHVVAEYAYVMCDEHFTYACPGKISMHSGTYSIATGWSGPDKYWAGVSSTLYEFKTREVANPYGFGITFASLSAYQWSILAALGLSRGGKHSAPRP